MHQVGAGVLGPVFRGHDPESDRTVALKSFPLDITPEQAAAFAHELQRLTSLDLSHPSLIVPWAAGVEGSTAYIVEEYFVADSMDTAVRQYGPAPVPDAVRLIGQLAGSLDFAAAAGVHHGALHPRDVLVAPREVRLTGIGVVGALEHVGIRPAARRPYAAPERMDASDWGLSADVFSLAVIAHELLTGRRPAAAGETLQPDVESLHAVEPAALLEVFARAFSARPEDRQPSALAFAAALKHALTGQPIDAQLPGPPAGEKPRPRRGSRPPASAHPAPAAPVSPPEAPGPDREAAPLAIASAPAVNPAIAEESGSGPEPAPVVAASASAVQDEPEPDSEATVRAQDAGLPPAQAVELVHPPSPVSMEERGAPPVPLIDDGEPPPPRTVQDLELRPSDPDDFELRPPAVEEIPPARTPVAPAAAASVAAAGSGLDHRPEGRYRDVMPTAAPAPEPQRSPFDDRPARFSRVSAVALLSMLLVGVALGIAVGYFLASGDEVRPSSGGQRVPSTAPAATPPSSGSDPAALREEPRLPPSEAAAGSAAPRRDTTDGTTSTGDPGVRLPTADHRPATPKPSERRPGAPGAQRRASAARAAAAPPAPRTRKPIVFEGPLSIVSRPPGARVFFDGHPVGTTPMSLSKASAGSHVVRLELPGYFPWSGAIQVVAGEQNRVAASLEPRAARSR